MKQLCFFAIIFFMVLTQPANAQSKTSKSLTVTDFDAPFNEISLDENGDEDSDEDFVLDSLVKIINKKGNPIKKEEIVEGSEVSITYIENGDKKIVTEIKLLTVGETGKVDIKGLLDGFSNGFGIVGGNKVKLGENVVIQGKGKETFKTFDDPALKLGSKVSVKGMRLADGSILAKQVEVRDNKITEDDKKFMEFTKTRFNGGGLQKFTGEKGTGSTSKKEVSTYTGNLKVGGVSYSIVNDIDAQGLIAEIGDKLLPDYVKEEDWQKEHTDVNFIFYLIQDDVPNAYALPDGKVFVHTGLLKIAENSAQIAFVMSHEISHVLYKHGTAKFKKNQNRQSFVNGVNKVGNVAGRTFRGLTGLSVKKPTTAEAADAASSLVGGNALAKTGVKVLTIAGAAAIDHFKKGEFTNVFSKKKEAEADRVALYYTQNAGYDIREVPKFWHNMMAINSDPTYMENLGSSLKSSLAKNLNQMGDADLGTQMLTIGTEALFNGSFNSVYISHPLSKQRLSASNKALTSTYRTTDFSKTIVDKQEYQNTVKRLK